MHPTKALCYPNTTPLLLCKETKSSRIVRIEVLFGYEFEEGFRKDYMSIFELVIGVLLRVMDPGPR